MPPSGILLRRQSKSRTKLQPTAARFLKRRGLVLARSLWGQCVLRLQQRGTAGHSKSLIALRDGSLLWDALEEEKNMSTETLKTPHGEKKARDVVLYSATGRQMSTPRLQHKLIATKRTGGASIRRTHSFHSPTNYRKDPSPSGTKVKMRKE
ncbi:hypothetical protein NDU88_005282 [Pleurodeles waltl]|uniref:Uncharacterized protein n=1 Tax=Pleurodeles waltl TaxID=8319 RepID=A0AAV7RLU1_PLEWA|nr:hypothetical protein NDU88_005282 [Pleurodeles waltl]